MLKMSQEHGQTIQKKEKGKYHINEMFSFNNNQRNSY